MTTGLLSVVVRRLLNHETYKEVLIVLRSDGICDAILNQGKTAPERTAVF